MLRLVFLSRLRILHASLLCCLAGSSFVAAEDDVEAESSFKFVPSANLRFSTAEIQKGVPEGSPLESLSKTKTSKVEFHWFQYGDASSRAVGVMFDPDTPSELYVDVDRDQKFSESEVFSCEDSGLWHVSLAAEYGARQAKTSLQRIRISRTESDGSFLIATAGIRKGKANFDGKLQDAIIEDRNANGLWFDAEDRLFVDVDGNGRISRLRERIPCHGMRNIHGQLYSIAGSAAGDAVTFDLVTETGTLIPTIEMIDGSGTITSVSGQLGSSTGVGISIDAIDKPVQVPIGDWHLEHLKVEIKADDEVFLFVFARLGTKTLVSIGDGEEKNLELVGGLELSANVSAQSEGDKAYLTINPALSTESDCYLVASKMGTRSAANENRLNAYSRDFERDLDAGSSGFS